MLFRSSLSIYISFTVHLVGVKTKWIENGGEKIGEKWVICVFGWEGKGGEKMVGLGTFLLVPTKIQFSRDGEKMGRREELMEITHLPLVLPRISVT